MIFRLDAVGDFVLSTPAIREIRMNYPFAYITLVVRKAVYPMAERCPYVNEILVFDMSHSEHNVMEWLSAVKNFAGEYLWKRHFDMAFCLHGWVGINLMLMLYLSGAKERVGYANVAFEMFKDQSLSIGRSITRLLFTKPILKKKEIEHSVTENLCLLREYGMRLNSTQIEIWYDTENKIRAKNILNNFASGKTKIIAGIGANHLARKYPIERYLQAFEKIIKKDVAIIIIGGSSEIDDAKFLQNNLPKESVLNLVELKMDWRTTAAVIAQSDMYIGNDTGVMHISAALHVPVIYLSKVAKDRRKIFPDIVTEREMFFPWQTKTILLQPEHQLGECAKIPNYLSCSAQNAHCITQINPDEIVSAYDKMADFIKTVKEIKCPHIIQNINQDFLFYAESIFND